jgi:hypothetical protein
LLHIFQGQEEHQAESAEIGNITECFEENQVGKAHTARIFLDYKIAARYATTLPRFTSRTARVLLSRRLFLFVCCRYFDSDIEEEVDAREKAFARRRHERAKAV